MAKTPVSAEDYFGIQRLVHRYIDTVIHRDSVGWGATWAEDATWYLGPDRSVEGRDAIVALWKSAMAGQHAVTQMAHTCDLWYADSTDAAAGRWYINEWFRRTNGEVGMLIAHYDDTYRKIDGDWLFTGRTLTKHYHGAPDLSAPFLSSAELLQQRGLSPDV